MVHGTNYGSESQVELSYFKIVGLLIIFERLVAGGNWSSSQCLYQYELYSGQPASHGQFQHSERGEIILSSADTLHLKHGYNIHFALEH